MTDTELRNPPVQQRATDTLQHIHQAALELLEIHGRVALTTSMIAERAGISVGGFYRYYRDKWQMLAVIDPVGELVDGEEAIAALQPGTVLLCSSNEIFWLAPNQLERVWYAPGYNPAEYTWTDAGVADWGPLTILRVGRDS
ncbi:MAG: TetR/AcrR family transcriptional regulator [Rhodoglobus sp.]